MSNIVSDNYSKQGVLDFATETPVEFPGTSVIIDAEKFMLKDNTYNENYAGAEAAIVSVQGFRRVHMSGDTYIDNEGTYLEALNYLGNIPATGEADFENGYTPQAWNFGAYYITDGNPNTISVTTEANLAYKQYPIGPLKIGSSFYVHATGLKFDNNAFPVTAPTSTYVSRHTSAILFESIYGEIHLNSLTIQNYKGMDIGKINTIIGETNAIWRDPTERTSGGVPNNPVSAPEFIVDFGFSPSLINFYEDTTSNTKIQLDKLVIDGLTLKNLTHYSPAIAIVPVLHLGDETPIAEISNLDIQDVDTILGLTSLFKLTNYGTLNIDRGTISRINVNAFNYENVDYKYLGKVGSVFEFSNMQLSTTYSEFTYSINNLEMDHIYGINGGAFYFSALNEVTEYHPTKVTLNTITLRNSYAVEFGLVYFKKGGFETTITNSLFHSNTGIYYEADLRIEFLTNDLAISSTKFLNSKNTNLEAGMSIHVNMGKPFFFTIFMTNVTVM